MDFSSLNASAHLAAVHFDWLPGSMNSWNSEVGDDSLSCQPPGLTQRPSILQRSVCINPSEFWQRAVSSPSASLNGAENPAKRLFYSAGDFQNNGRAESPVSCESSVTNIEGMSRACRYSPEEKKQRIERYRSKRSQRNFNKKIKYACRKSLADKRPRIRGRFARYNEEVEKMNYPVAVQWSRGEDDEANGADNWIKYFFDAYSSNLIP